MLKIIHKKRYDSDTATSLAHWSNGLGGNDFNHVRETLCLTKRGAYFLYGRGGPASQYRERSGNMWCGGSDIKPLTEEEAYQWCEKHGQNELIVTLFPDSVEDA